MLTYFLDAIQFIVSDFLEHDCRALVLIRRHPSPSCTYLDQNGATEVSTAEQLDLTKVLHRIQDQFALSAALPVFSEMRSQTPSRLKIGDNQSLT